MMILNFVFLFFYKRLKISKILNFFCLIKFLTSHIVFLNFEISKSVLNILFLLNNYFIKLKKQIKFKIFQMLCKIHQN